MCELCHVTEIESSIIFLAHFDKIQIRLQE